MSSRNYDAVVTSQWPSLLLAEYANIVPHVHIAHNIDAKLAQKFDPRPLRILGNGARTEKKEMQLLGRAGAIWALSHTDSIELTLQGVPNVTHVNLVSPRQQRPQHERTGAIGLLGKMSWPPNRQDVTVLAEEVLPRVHARLGSQMPRLVVAGRGSESMTVEGGAESFIDRLGVVDDVSTFYESIDAVVVPRAESVTGVSIKVLEALESGTRVITSGEVADAIRNPPGVERAESIEEMIDLVARLYCDEEAHGGTSGAPAVPRSSAPARRHPWSPRRAAELLDTCIDRLVHTDQQLWDVVQNRRGVRVQTVNLHHLYLALTDDDFNKRVRSADVITADGWPIAAYFRLVHRLTTRRVTGSALVADLVDSSRRSESSLAIGLLGADADVGDHITSRLIANRHTVTFREHGSRLQWSVDELSTRIAGQGADLVLVALTPPHSEMLADELAAVSPQTNIVAVGGSLDMFGGRTAHAPIWLRRAGLEWLYRMIKEPGRLTRRYVVECFPTLLFALIPAASLRIARRAFR